MASSRVSNTPINPQRVNPQFIGIAGKYSQHKKHRVKSDKKRQDVQTNFHYVVKLNEELDKGLQQKNKELARLRKVRERHNIDVMNKLQEEERRKKQLEELKRKSSEQRENLRNGIRNSHDTVKSSRVQNTNSVKEKIYQLQLEKKNKKREYFLQKLSKHQSVELGKKIGNEKVNEHYRQKNKQSIDNYCTMIKDEDEKSEKNEMMVKKMQQSIQSYRRNVDKKQNKLKNVLDEIGLYSVDSTQERRANMLATGQLFRSLNTSSSQRSKPGDILRMSYNKKNQTFN